MKALKVTSISPYGEHTIDHAMAQTLPEEMCIVAILKGVVSAGNQIKSFEIVEANRRRRCQTHPSYSSEEVMAR
jgi:hypothetical protein